MVVYPDWPAIPDAPMLDSWSKPDMYQDPRVTDMEGSNKRMLTRPGDDIWRVTFNILMTKAQLGTLETFMVVTCGRGTSRWRMRIWNGQAMATHIVQNAAKPVSSTISPKVIVGFDLFVFPRLV